MQQHVEEVPTEAATQLQPPPARETITRRRDPAGLWRAVAGMAISVAIASLIVTLEFTSQAMYRANRMHQRAQTLLSRVYSLKAEVAAERARIDGPRRGELAATKALRALLRAPDAAMLLLSPPTASVYGARTAQGPEATLALGPKEHRAVLMVAGLKPFANDAVFVLWWSPSYGAPVRAAEFRTAGDGSALVTATLPAGLNVTAAMVTAERAASTTAAKAGKALAQTGPSGPVQLRGMLLR